MCHDIIAMQSVIVTDIGGREFQSETTCSAEVLALSLLGLALGLLSLAFHLTHSLLSLALHLSRDMLCLALGLARLLRCLTLHRFGLGLGSITCGADCFLNLMGSGFCMEKTR